MRKTEVTAIVDALISLQFEDGCFEGPVEEILAAVEKAVPSVDWRTPFDVARAIWKEERDRYLAEWFRTHPPVTRDEEPEIPPRQTERPEYREELIGDVMYRRPIRAGEG